MNEIQSLARGLKILEILGESPDGVSITDLADNLGVDKGSASRLMSTLVTHGFAEKNPSTRRFFLGPQVVTLSRSLLARMPLREAARPFLRELMERTGECSHLAVAARGKVLYIDQAESPATLRVNVQVGQTAPLHCTALGKAILAFGGAEIPGQMEAFTSKTITEPSLLLTHLDGIRHQGYAVDDEEYDPDVRCVAVPVFDFQHRVAGSIGISGPAARITLERIPKLAETVVEIGKALSSRV